MIIKQYYLWCLAHASYLVADEQSGTAAVIDPQRDVDQYLRDARRLGVSVNVPLTRLRQGLDELRAIARSSCIARQVTDRRSRRASCCGLASARSWILPAVSRRGGRATSRRSRSMRAERPIVQAQTSLRPLCRSR